MVDTFRHCYGYSGCLDNPVATATANLEPCTKPCRYSVAGQGLVVVAAEIAQHTLTPNRPAGRPPRGATLLICQPSREAERRFCAVGRPAWMPGEPRWAMDGPWRRAHGAGPERGNLSAAKAVRWGEDLLVPFGSFQKGLAVKAKPIFRLDANAGYVRGGPVVLQRIHTLASQVFGPLFQVFRTTFRFHCRESS